MSKRIAIGFALAGCLVAMPALASQHGKDHNKTENNKTCRSERATGSIMQKRICHTPAEWAAIDGQNGDQAHEMLGEARNSRNEPQRQ